MYHNEHSLIASSFTILTVTRHKKMMWLFSWDYLIAWAIKFSMFFYRWMKRLFHFKNLNGIYRHPKSQHQQNTAIETWTDCQLAILFFDWLCTFCCAQKMMSTINRQRFSFINLLTFVSFSISSCYNWFIFCIFVFFCNVFDRYTLNSDAFIPSYLWLQ